MSDITGNSNLAREKGRKGGLHKKGVKHKRTILKEALGLDNIHEIEDFKEGLLKLGKQFLKNKDINLKSFAWKELLKYTFPQKQNIDAKIKGTINFVANKKIVDNTPNDNGD